MSRNAKPAKPAKVPRPETKGQRANRLDSQFEGPCGASYDSAHALSVHVENCSACQAVNH